jgi:hypothetical protein
MIPFPEEKLVKIVIPIYKSNLHRDEIISLRQCCSVLSRYPIVIAKPESLDITNLRQQYPRLETEDFPDEYFQSIESYNRLMLSSVFYERFLDYEYVLIYQLDAFVFRDELAFWCSKSYDYIGAPWIPRGRFWKGIKNIFNLLIDHNIRKLQRLQRQVYYKVGNGGFSLRRTRSFHQIATQEKSLIQEYLHSILQRKYLPEDVFWALEPHRLHYDFSIPEYKEALLFSFDKYPSTCFRITKTIPFGCHGWNRKKMLPFWQKYMNISDEIGKL